MTRLMKSLAKLVLRSRIFIPVWAWLLARRLQPMHVSGEPNALRVLVFSPNRWGANMHALSRCRDVDFLGLHIDTCDKINSLFRLKPFKHPGPWGHINYFKETDRGELRRREKHRLFLSRLLRSLKRQARLQVAITPTIYYIREVEWVRASDEAELPMVAVHKEFTIIDERHMPVRVERWRDRQFQYRGAHICVVNEFAKRLFSETGICPPERISVTGMLRLDELQRPDSPYRIAAERDRQLVTFFSFAHLMGDFDTDRVRNIYFSLNGDEGFIDLFNETHIAFAKLALSNPDVDFAIKAKLVSDAWRDEIDQVLLPATGKTIADIPNLHWSETPALDLIRDSAAVIAFNSTVVLEARALDRPTILPLFAEAADKHAFQAYFLPFRDVFATAESAVHMSSLVERCLDGERIMPDDDARLNEMVQYYGGHADAHNAERVVAVLRRFAASDNREHGVSARPAAPLTAAGE